MASYNLAQIYREGTEVDKDFDKSLKYYQLAAEQGYAQAQYNLAVIYLKGINIAQDKKEASKFMLSAAKQVLQMPNSI